MRVLILQTFSLTDYFLWLFLVSFFDLLITNRYSLDQIRRSEKAIELLGEPINPGFSASSTRGGSGLFNIKFKVIGPKNKVTISLILEEVYRDEHQLLVIFNE